MQPSTSKHAGTPRRSLREQSDRQPLFCQSSAEIEKDKEKKRGLREMEDEGKKLSDNRTTQRRKMESSDKQLSWPKDYGTPTSSKRSRTEKDEDKYLSKNGTTSRIGRSLSRRDTSEEQSSSSRHSNTSSEIVEDEMESRGVIIDKKRKKEEQKRAVKQWNKKMIEIANHRTYKEIERTLKTFERHDMVPLEEGPVTNKDRNHKDDVYAGMAHESPKDWDARQKEMGNTEFTVDYVIASEPREMGHTYFSTLNGPATKSLMKFPDFPVPSWEIAGDDDAYEQRLLRLDFAEFSLRQTLGDERFCQIYPNRYHQPEDGRGAGGYIKHPRTLYKNKLRAIEYHYNIINRKFKRAPVYIEDWTDIEEADKTLRELQYIQKSIVTADVKKLLKNRGQMAHIKRVFFLKSKCGKECKNGRFSCSSVMATNGVLCCGMHESMEMGPDGVPRFLKEGDKRMNQCLVRIECTSDCGCDPKECNNRVVQRGRQHPLVIFRDHMKGWTIRGVTEIGRHDLIAEYCGQVQAGKSKGRAQQYDLSLGYSLPDGRADTLHISAFHQGNESRFLSHCCEPNCYAETTIVERNGLFFNRVVLRAKRRIIRGEELTFDYFEGRNLDDDDFMDSKEMFPKEGCLCGAPNCRFTPAKMREAAVKYALIMAEEKGQLAAVQRRAIQERRASQRRGAEPVNDAESRESASTMREVLEKELTPASTTNSGSMEKESLRGRIGQSRSSTRQNSVVDNDPMNDESSSIMDGEQGKELSRPNFANSGLIKEENGRGVYLGGMKRTMPWKFRSETAREASYSGYSGDASSSDPSRNASSDRTQGFSDLQSDDGPGSSTRTFFQDTKRRKMESLQSILTEIDKKRDQEMSDIDRVIEKKQIEACIARNMAEAEAKIVEDIKGILSRRKKSI